MELLGLDHSQLNVKGGHPPHFYLLKSETLPLRNLLVCPRNTPPQRQDSASLIKGATVSTAQCGNTPTRGKVCRQYTEHKEFVS